MNQAMLTENTLNQTKLKEKYLHRIDNKLHVNDAFQ